MSKELIDGSSDSDTEELEVVASNSDEAQMVFTQIPRRVVREDTAGLGEGTSKQAAVSGAGTGTSTLAKGGETNTCSNLQVMCM